MEVCTYPFLSVITCIMSCMMFAATPDLTERPAMKPTPRRWSATTLATPTKDRPTTSAPKDRRSPWHGLPMRTDSCPRATTCPPLPRSPLRSPPCCPLCPSWSTSTPTPSQLTLNPPTLRHYDPIDSMLYLFDWEKINFPVYNNTFSPSLINKFEAGLGFRNELGFYNLTLQVYPSLLWTFWFLITFIWISYIWILFLKMKYCRSWTSKVRVHPSSAKPPHCIVDEAITKRKQFHSVFIIVCMFMFINSLKTKHKLFQRLILYVWCNRRT